MRSYQMCARCIMDTSVPEIQFDKNGVCDICKSFERKLKDRVVPKEKSGSLLFKIISQIKNAGSGKNMTVLSE